MLQSTLRCDDAHVTGKHTNNYKKKGNPQNSETMKLDVDFVSAAINDMSAGIGPIDLSVSHRGQKEVSAKHISPSKGKLMLERVARTPPFLKSLTVCAKSWDSNLPSATANQPSAANSGIYRNKLPFANSPAMKRLPPMPHLTTSIRANDSKSVSETSADAPISISCNAIIKQYSNLIEETILSTKRKLASEVDNSKIIASAADNLGQMDCVESFSSALGLKPAKNRTIATKTFDLTDETRTDPAEHFRADFNGAEMYSCAANKNSSLDSDGPVNTKHGVCNTASLAGSEKTVKRDKVSELCRLDRVFKSGVFIEPAVTIKSNAKLGSQTSNVTSDSQSSAEWSKSSRSSGLLNSPSNDESLMNASKANYDSKAAYLGKAAVRCHPFNKNTQKGAGLPGAGLPGAGLPGKALPGTGLPGAGLLRPIAVKIPASTVMSHTEEKHASRQQQRASLMLNRQRVQRCEPYFQRPTGHYMLVNNTPVRSAAASSMADLKYNTPQAWQPQATAAQPPYNPPTTAPQPFYNRPTNPTNQMQPELSQAAARAKQLKGSGWRNSNPSHALASDYVNHTSINPTQMELQRHVVRRSISETIQPTSSQQVSYNTTIRRRVQSPSTQSLHITLPVQSAPGEQTQWKSFSMPNTPIHSAAGDVYQPFVGGQQAGWMGNSPYSSMFIPGVRQTESKMVMSGPSHQIQYCEGCGASKPMFVCSMCQRSWYCSRECQMNQWQNHSTQCTGSRG